MDIAKKYHVIENSWDRLLIPAPFTEAVVVFGDPLYVDGTSDTDIRSTQRALEASLHELKRHAESVFSHGHTGLSAFDSGLNERN